MFSGFLTAPPELDFGERVVSTVATQSLRHLFTSSESVDVSIHCNPANKLLQGQVDNVQMHGSGLVIRKDFWVEEMTFETSAVALDMVSVLTGKFKLNQPTHAIARVILTEAGINRAFASPLVQQHLRRVDAPELLALSGGEPVSFTDVVVKLLPDNRVRINAQAHLPNGIIPIRLEATVAIERRRRILFQNPQFNNDTVPQSQQATAKVLTLAFAQVLDGMVDLDRFDLDGVSLKLNRLETHGDRLIFSGYAEVDHFPKVG